MDQKDIAILLGLYPAHYKNYDEYSDQITTEELIDFLKNGKISKVRETALSLLGSRVEDDKAKKYILNLILNLIREEKDSEYLRTALVLLGNFDFSDDQDSIQFVINLSKNEDSKDLKEDVIFALKKTSGEDVINFLLPIAINKLGEEKPIDQKNAISSLGGRLGGRNDARVISAFHFLFEKHKDDNYNIGILSRIAIALKNVVFEKPDNSEMTAHTILRCLSKHKDSSVRHNAIKSLPLEPELLWGCYNNAISAVDCHNLIFRFGELEIDKAIEFLEKVMESANRDDNEQNFRYFYSACALLRHKDLPVSKANEILGDLIDDSDKVSNLYDYSMHLVYNGWNQIQNIIVDRLPDWGENVSPSFINRIIFSFLFGNRSAILKLRSFCKHRVPTKMLIVVVSGILEWHADDSRIKGQLSLLLENVMDCQHFNSIFSNIKSGYDVDFWITCLFRANIKNHANTNFDYGDYVEKIILDCELDLEVRIHVKVLFDKKHLGSLQALINVFKDKKEDLLLRCSSFPFFCDEGFQFVDVPYLFSFLKIVLESNLKMSKKEDLLNSFCKIPDPKVKDLLRDYFYEKSEMISIFTPQTELVTVLFPKLLYKLN
jgi:hypothetical protein